MNKQIVSLQVRKEKIKEVKDKLKTTCLTVKGLADDLGIREGVAYGFFNGKPVRINTFKDIAEKLNMSWNDLTNYEKCSRVMTPHWWLFDDSFNDSIDNVLIQGNYFIIIGNYPINCLLKNDVFLQKLIFKNCPVLILTQGRSFTEDIDYLALLTESDCSEVRKNCEKFNMLIEKMIAQSKSMGFDKINLKKSSITSLSWHGIFSCVRQNGKVKLDPRGISMIINQKDSFSFNRHLRK